MSTPRNRLLRRQDPPTGYPMNSLVAYFDMMQDNLLLQSETFSNAAWSKTRSYIAANCAADPETGLYTVDKLVEDGTAANYHSVNQARGVTPLTAVFDLKAAGRSWVTLTPAAGSYTGVSFYLTNGVIGTKPSGQTASMEHLGDGWYRCRASSATGTANTFLILAEADNDITYSGLGHQGTAAAGGSTTTAVLAAAASATNDVYNGTDTLVFSDAPTVWHTVTGYVGATKTATFTPARAAVPDGTTYTVGPGIYIARAQLNPGTTARDYQVNTDMQTLASLYGKTPTFQRGLTTGEDASDGAYGLNGWGGVTDDIMLGSALADGTMAGPFDIPLVGLFNGTAGTIVSLAATGVTTHYQRVAYNGSGQIRIGSKAGAGAETFSDDLAVSTTDILALRFRSDGTTLTLTNHATGTSVTLASQSPTGACRLGIGCTAGSTVADIASAITATLVTVHGAMLGTAQWTRAYRDLKGRAARKGVVVLP